MEPGTNFSLNRDSTATPGEPDPAGAPTPAHPNVSPPARTPDATPDKEVTIPDTGVSSSFGPYVTLASLGMGGMGVVYRARHSTLDRIVALKTMRDDIILHPQHAQR